MAALINIADLVDPATGKTYRQMNLETQHNIPTGALVEIGCEEDDDEWAGVRLFVAWQGRDCDGTPLYWLTPSKDAVRYNNTHAPHDEFWKGSYVGGFSEGSLTMIRPPSRGRPPQGE
jgi:hypothetical protein